MFRVQLSTHLLPGESCTPCCAQASMKRRGRAEGAISPALLPICPSDRPGLRNQFKEL
jgi:hypothetical protein